MADPGLDHDMSSVPNSSLHEQQSLAATARQTPVTQALQDQSQINEQQEQQEQANWGFEQELMMLILHASKDPPIAWSAMAAILGPPWTAAHLMYRWSSCTPKMDPCARILCMYKNKRQQEVAKAQEETGSDKIEPIILDDARRFKILANTINEWHDYVSNDLQSPSADHYVHMYLDWLHGKWLSKAYINSRLEEYAAQASGRKATGKSESADDDDDEEEDSDESQAGTDDDTQAADGKDRSEAV